MMKLFIGGKPCLKFPWQNVVELLLLNRQDFFVLMLYTGSALESIALKAAMIMPVLLLQRPHIKSKESDHVKLLSRRLLLWSKGDIDSLVSKGRTLQSLFSKSNKSRPISADASNVARRFAQLMMSGKVKDALRLLSSDSDGRVLPFNSDVMDSLIRKHPRKQPLVSSALVTDFADPPLLSCLIN